MVNREELYQAVVEPMVAEQATGCRGAGSYRAWAEAQGYPHLEVFDWTSSAGDWSFIVSRDGEEWHMMYQENNWPLPGFTYQVDTEQVFYGTAEDALQQCVAVLEAGW